MKNFKRNRSEKNIIILGSIIVTVLLNSLVMAQGESNFKVTGYVDAYYAYDNDDNGSSLRQFSAVAPIRDQFRINLVQITGTYSASKVRGVATLQFGDIPYYNWPQSPNQYLQYIQEANIGFQPAKISGSIYDISFLTSELKE
ncbi:MAG: outer membrane beta-barrel protein [Ignavibacteria bacterium]|nr:outer membrane beta-barrel protein [Ignavibacteria bacterium]